MAELKACPFCGNVAILNSGEYSVRYAERKNDVPKNSRIIRSVKYPSGKTYYEYRQRGFVPQCVKTGCLGRVYKLFELEAEAIEAWNRRAEDGRNEV